MNHSNAKIFLAEQRGCTETTKQRCYHTFNYGTYQNRHRDPFGSLHTLNDETLAAGETVHYQAPAQLDILILPLVGACTCQIDSSIHRAEAGQILHASVSRGDQVTLSNNYQQELINYLFIALSSRDKSSCQVVDVPIEQQPNTLHRVPLPSQAFKVHLGIFGGRQEAEMFFASSNDSCFVFVIDGAFEVNNRLLHPRDGLALWNTNRLEFEALSPDAILLVLELVPHHGIGGI